MTRLDILHEKFQRRREILANEDIYLDALSLCESLITYYSLLENQFKLIETESDPRIKWTLLDSTKGLITTLDKRLARLIPCAEKEIMFWMNQPFDRSHKMLILANAENLSFSLKNIQNRFERQLELLSDETEDELKVEDTILKLASAQTELEKNIEIANKAARKKYLGEALTKQEKRKIFNKYIDFKKSLYNIYN